MNSPKGLPTYLAAVLLHQIGKVQPAFWTRGSNFPYQFPTSVWQKKANEVEVPGIPEVSDPIPLASSLSDLNSRSFPSLFGEDEPYCWLDFIEGLGQGNALYIGTNYSELKKWFKAIAEGTVNDNGELWVTKVWGGSRLATHLLNLAHRVASGGEKQSFKAADVSDAWKADPFGIMTSVHQKKVDELWTQVQEEIIPKLNDTDQPWVPKLLEVYRQLSCDHRVPFHDVTLEDIVTTASAFYRAWVGNWNDGALTHSALTHNENLKVKVVSIRMDALAWLSGAGSIAELLMRQRLWKDFLDHAKVQVERTWGWGTEFHRDENGSLFLVPDRECGDLDWKNEYIDSSELERTFCFRPKPQWLGQKYVGHRDDVADGTKFIGEVLTGLPSDSLALEWTIPRSPRSGAHRCMSCGVRMVTPRTGNKHLCPECFENKTGAAKTWWDDLKGPTIWVDEVADARGRLALIVGKIGLDEFLREDKLPLANGNEWASVQGVSPYRRAADTCREFWQTCGSAIREMRPARQRLKLKLAGKDIEQCKKSQTYELEVKPGIRMDLVCEGGAVFFSVINIGWLAKAWGDISVDDLPARLKGLTASRFFSSSGYGETDENLGTVKISEASLDTATFPPCRPIWEESRTFLLLIPADQADEAVDLIVKQYRKSFAFVQHRLPLMVGAVFANSRLPLRALLEAGKSMLGRPFIQESWKFENTSNISDNFKLSFLDEQNQPRTLTIPAKLGCGIADKWYGYFERSTPPSPCLVGELTANDSVKIWPSVIDFRYLASAGERFEISYNGRGRRMDDEFWPWPLDRWEEFRSLWNELGPHSLARNQAYRLRETWDRLRERWELPAAPLEPTIPQAFCLAVIADVPWTTKPSSDQQETWAKALASGLMQRVLGLKLQQTGDWNDE